MFYRRKFTAALLHEFNGKLPELSLHYLMFFCCSRQEKPVYDFVPVLSGPFSFTLHADIKAMVIDDMASLQNSHVVLKTSTAYTDLLKSNDLAVLKEVKTNFEKFTEEALLTKIYGLYPYFTINTALPEKRKSEDFMSGQHQKSSVLFTLGYEGVSPETYLNRLLKNGIKVLVDVRNNPFSMKFGFSKGPLQDFCAKTGIAYLHIPDLGIPSDDRKQKDSVTLFSDYKNITLQKTVVQQQQVLDLLRLNHRIALTCFEADYNQCHRKLLANAISELPGWDSRIEHL